LQPRQELLDLALAEARADAAEIDEMRSPTHADEKRPKLAVGRRPAADHDFMSGPAFGLGPVAASGGLIGRVQPLRDDSLQRQPAGRSQHGVARRHEMLGVANELTSPRASPRQQFPQASLPLGEREVAQVSALNEQEIE